MRLLAAAALVGLGGCVAIPPAVPMAISAAGGLMEILKEGFDIKLDLVQMRAVQLPPSTPAPPTVPPAPEEKQP